MTFCWPMASACVNNPPPSYPSYPWLSPRISFSRDDDLSKPSPPPPSSDPPTLDPHGLQDLPIDFEFRLEDPATMLPADELFSDGKLVPLQVTSIIKPLSSSSSGASSVDAVTEIRSPEGEASKSIQVTDPYLFSPKAPRCSSRWKELLGLKRLYQTHPNSTHKTEPQKTTLSFSSSSSSNPSSMSAFKHFLHRTSKPCSNYTTSSSTSLDYSLSQPLLKDADCESVSFSSTRLSFSSSSSSHDHEDLPRLSLDAEKTNPNPNPFILNRNQNVSRIKISSNNNSNSGNCNSNSTNNLAAAGARAGRSPIRTGERESSEVAINRGVSVDSPRMNSSGKIVFQSLERSSSSPSSFNGGPRFKHRGMERSYSANVRVAPVLNVPVCSLRGSSSKSGGGGGSVFGFGQLFSSPQKREGFIHKGHHHHHHYPQQQSNSRNRKD